MKIKLAVLLVLLAATLVAQGQNPIQHVVVIFQENRTPDNLFQGLCSHPFGKPKSCSTQPQSNQYNIQTRDWFDKKVVGGTIQPSTVPLANNYDLSHSHPAFLLQCDVDASGVCQMDGAASVACGGTCPTQPQFRYVDNSTGILNPYLEMATQYGWANYMFQTNQGPSFPAHQFIFGGTSAPSSQDDALGTFSSENMFGGKIAGCIATAGTTVPLVTPAGEKTSIYPCFEHQTIPDILPPQFSWRYYAPSAGSIWTAPNAIKHICQPNMPSGGACVGSEWLTNVDLNPADVLRDISQCKLRSASWVIPTGQNSDHAGGGNNSGGPSWVASIVNAIGNSSTCDNNTGYWKNTAIILTWDDWGGWYDHEAPTILDSPQGDYQYGFRVPLIVISAYTPAGYIDNVRHDFGSILRFIENTFGITEGALGFADARASDDLTGFFQFRQKPRSFQNINAPKGADYFLNDVSPPTDPDDD